MPQLLNDNQGKAFKDNHSDSLICDRELVIRVLKNDEAALVILVKRYLGLVYSIAKYYAKDSDDADDITQEVFVKVWKNLKRFNLEKKFSSWIYEIAKNTSLDWLKKKKSVPLSEFEYNFGKNYFSNANLGPLTPYELACDTSLVKSLQAAIDKLSPAHQQVLILHSQQEMTFQQIANLTKESINTVKSRYLRAVASIKKFLTQN